MLSIRAQGRPFRVPRHRLTSCCAPAPAAAAAATPGTPAAGAAGPDAAARQYPAPPPAVSPVQGLIDLHVHCAPDIFGRAVTDDDAARLYRDRGMEAFAIKA